MKIVSKRGEGEEEEEKDGWRNKEEKENRKTENYMYGWYTNHKNFWKHFSLELKFLFLK